MVNFKKGQAISALAATAAFAAILTGCGGSSDSATIPGPTVSVSGSSTVAPGTPTGAVSSPVGTATPATVTVGGAAKSVVVPGGLAIDPAESVAVLDMSARTISEFVPDFSSSDATADTGKILISDDGDIDRDSGLFMDATGGIGTRGAGDVIVLPYRGHSYRITVLGPVKVVKDGSVLTIRRKAVFVVPVRKFAGQSYVAWPTSVLGKVPSNGGSSFGLTLSVGIPSVFAGYHENLKIEHANGILDQNRIANGVGAVTFSDLTFSGSSQIPRNGVDKVTWTVEAP